MLTANVNTEQARQVVHTIRLFRDGLQEKTKALGQAMQEHYNKVCQEYQNAQSKLSQARSALNLARNTEMGLKLALAGAMFIPPPARFAAVAAATAALEIAKAKREDCERKIPPLEQAVQIFQEEVKNLESLLQETWEETKQLLIAYDEEHNALCQRLEMATELVEERYSIPPPEFQQLMQQVADLQSQLEQANAQIDIEQANARYQELLEARKEEFIRGENNDMGVPFSEYHLPIFPAVFATTIALKDLDADKSVHHFYGIKALQKALEEQPNLQELFDEEERLQIHKGLTPKGYLWHFDGNPPLGNLQLVREEVLLRVPHTKGYPLWQQYKTQV
ncbi:HNH endonuclease [Helicobacter salomonis]|uniref:HNH endonuclease n=1 Tax=Helicobacter salomonis TaxID=56878 RepID=UPI000CF0F2CE|nr:HNH endonuclease [Helicobacter salomonis]